MDFGPWSGAVSMVPLVPCFLRPVKSVLTQCLWENRVGLPLCSLCIEILGYSLSAWYSALATNSHLFGTLGRILPFFFFIPFCSLLCFCFVKYVKVLSVIRRTISAEHRHCSSKSVSARSTTSELQFLPNQHPSGQTFLNFPKLIGQSPIKWDEVLYLPHFCFWFFFLVRRGWIWSRGNILVFHLPVGTSCQVCIWRLPTITVGASDIKCTNTTFNWLLPALMEFSECKSSFPFFPPEKPPISYMHPCYDLSTCTHLYTKNNLGLQWSIWRTLDLNKIVPLKNTLEKKESHISQGQWAAVFDRYTSCQMKLWFRHCSAKRVFGHS